MPALWLVTLIWAFSFSLIGQTLSGQVDAWITTLIRATLALCLFSPWLFTRKPPLAVAWRLAAIGGIQLGLMYAFFFNSFAYLSVAEVALFTIFTPLWIVLLDDLLERRLQIMTLLAALLAVLAAAWMRVTSVEGEWLTGFALVQGANLCFAIGQVSYRRLSRHYRVALPARTVFAWFFLGALLIALAGAVLQADWTALPASNSQWLVLLWLGLVASGLGYFVWNQKACQVSVGQLAVMNNALIPLAIAVNWLLWGQSLSIKSWLPGAALLILALWLAPAKELDTRGSQKGSMR
jgi:carboxylate/amino acid/amine transporter